MNDALARGLLFESDGRPYLLLANGSRVYELPAELAATIAKHQASVDVRALDKTLRRCGLESPEQIESKPPQRVGLRALSLAVAQTCNMGCTYCYAEGGDFGGRAAMLSLETAYASIDRLISDVPIGEAVNIAFMGGEPLVNRSVIRAATQYALDRAKEKNIRAGFSITTNGTLITPEDGEFFEQHGFAVTISLDGLAEAHDAQRPFKNGMGSFERIIKRIEPMLTMQQRMQVSARVTVTPRNLNLPVILDGLITLGFHSVGFSPMLSSPTGRDEMDVESLQQMLEQMTVCALRFEQNIIEGRRYPFSNAISAMQEIHRGSHRPYPCGAGAGYVGVSAQGRFYSCHRFVGDESAALGNVWQGLDDERQSRWLAERHVHFQDPCTRCWARYLCGGGCHYEVLHKGRNSCDYVRGWLTECLKIYVRLLDRRPDYFQVSLVGAKKDKT